MRRGGVELRRRTALLCHERQQRRARHRPPGRWGPTQRQGLEAAIDAVDLGEPEVGEGLGEHLAGIAVVAIDQHRLGAWQPADPLAQIALGEPEGAGQMVLGIAGRIARVEQAVGPTLAGRRGHEVERPVGRNPAEGCLGHRRLLARALAARVPLRNGSSSSPSK